MLPHAYPFRLVDRAGDGAGQPVAWTVGGALDRGAGAAPAMLAVEMMAQAALVLLARGGSGEGPGEGAGLLAGVDALVLHATIGAGDRLEAHAEVAGRFGRLVKVRARLTRDGAAVAEGDLLLALG